MPIAQIAVGASYLDECPKQPNIPIYLVVAGVFGLLLALSCLPCTWESKDTPITLLSLLCMVWNCLSSIFLFCWLITGSVWIYSIYEPNYNKTATDVDPYCDKTLYLFAFWTTTLVYIFLGTHSSCICKANGKYQPKKATADVDPHCKILVVL
ncbi:hypothetical protein LDENG_00130470 [Lucifuga dentata]|nr:hypothetical protein LDENG_00130470 [Lucifuga dentata]